MITFSLFGPSVLAQKNIETQDLLWTGYNLKIKVSENWMIRQELEERTYWFPWRQHQFIARTFAERKLGKGWSAGTGFAYFVQSLPQDPEIRDYENQLELRPVLELGYRQDLSEKISFHHRYWSEFRFFEQQDGSFDFGNNRSRYKLEVRFKASDQITLKAFDEILINLGDRNMINVFDQNRIGGSLQYMPLKDLGFEIGYFNWFQQRRSAVDFYNRNIVRFTVHHTITVKRPKTKGS